MAHFKSMLASSDSFCLIMSHIFWAISGFVPHVMSYAWMDGVKPIE